MIRVKQKLFLTKVQRGQQKIRKEKPVAKTVEEGRIPRISRLMALAIRFETLIQNGDMADYAELARLAHVSRARITQIMNLLLLAPDLQEAMLFLPPVERGRDAIRLSDLQPIALEADWNRQRQSLLAGRLTVQQFQ